MWQRRSRVSVVRVVSAARRVVAWIRSHPQMADAALAVALVGAAYVSFGVTADLFRDPAHPRPGTAENSLGLAFVILPLALRRRAPLSMLLLSITAYVVYAVALGPLVEGSISVVALSLAVYSAAAHGRAPLRNWACGAGLLAIVGLQIFDNQLDLPLDLRLLGVVINVVLFCALWSLGAALSAGRQRARDLLQRTVELEHEREENARRAVFDERVRIARELHDVVAHHVSMMGVQAGAARVVLARDPAMARDALSSVEASSRQAVTELHRLLGVLRQAGDPDDLGPQPGLGQLQRLAASMSGSDLVVEVCVDGDERPVGPTVDVSAYRIVQEALTNTLKHAGASRADVYLRYGPDELEIEVVDDGAGDAAPSSKPGGLGLIGMRERAALHGGRLTAGPLAGGGYAVHARLRTTADGL